VRYKVFILLFVGTLVVGCTNMQVGGHMIKTASRKLIPSVDTAPRILSHSTQGVKDEVLSVLPNDIDVLVNDGIAVWDGSYVDGYYARHASASLGTYMYIESVNESAGVLVRVVGRPNNNSGAAIELSRDASEQLGFLEVGNTIVRMQSFGTINEAYREGVISARKRAEFVESYGKENITVQLYYNALVLSEDEDEVSRFAMSEPSQVIYFGDTHAIDTENTELSKSTVTYENTQDYNRSTVLLSDISTDLVMHSPAPLVKLAGRRTEKGSSANREHAKYKALPVTKSSLGSIAYVDKVDYVEAKTHNKDVVQYGAFLSQDNAILMLKKLKAAGKHDVFIEEATVNGSIMYRVRARSD